MKWFRLKIFGIVAGSVILCMAAVLGINYIHNNILGLGNSRLQSVLHENGILQEQLTAVTSRMHDLETDINKLVEQGNQLRLMVDLPVLDEETKIAGTGGTVVEHDISLTSDSSSKLLYGTRKIMQTLLGEMKVQEQSYQQIEKKYEYNKGYFAALPAIKPMEGYYSTKAFGMRLHPVLGIFKTHEGIDIVNDVGTPVYATGDGVIEMAGHSGGGFGYMVVIKHGYGYQSVYAHLSKIMVREGQRIKRGDLVAKSGRSGLVSGPHLHYEVRYNGVGQNPMDFFFDDVHAATYKKQVSKQ